VNIVNNNDFKVLNEIYKGNKMGIDAINYMKDKIKDNEFKKDVDRQYNEYVQMSEKIEDLVSRNNGKLEDTPAKDKIMGWTSVKMNTMIDNTTSHLSEMLIQGTVMGVIEGVRLFNQNKDLDQEVKGVVDEFLKTSEDNIQTLKKYL
jgi:ferritin-like metal-binding protein YciE